GKEFAPDPIGSATGVSSSEQVDQPSAYVTFFEKGNPDKIISQNLLAIQPASMDQGESVTVGDEEYQVFLRFKRLYKPYSVYLDDAQQINYEGTTTPRDYSSQIVLQDSETDNNLESKIWMNNPLRYGGETFYQSGMLDDPDGPDSTTLSVVTNTGWMVPYVSCAIVGVGMLAQFLMTLARFLNRRNREEPENAVFTDDDDPNQKATTKPALADAKSRSTVAVWFPMVMTVMMAFYLGGKLPAPKAEDGEFNLYAFGQIPVREQGRLKPLDSVARNTLRFLSKKVEFEDFNENKQPAIQFLLDLMIPVIPDEDSAEPTQFGTKADGYEVIYVENLEVQKFFDLEKRKGFLYSYNELRPQIPKMLGHLQNIQAIKQGKKEGELSVMDLKLQELFTKFKTYHTIRDGFIPLSADQVMPDLEDGSQSPQEGMARVVEAIRIKQSYEKDLIASQVPLLIPEISSGQKTDDPEYAGNWLPYPSEKLIPEISPRLFIFEDALFQRGFLEEKPQEPKEANPLAVLFSKIRTAYIEDDAKGFNKAVAGYLGYLHESPPPAMDKSRIAYEAYFNHTSLYYYASAISIFAFMLGLFSWIGWSEPFRKAAFWITVFLLVVHTYGLVSRIYISGRPPVTNLYSSAIFIGWGAIALGLLLEWLYPIGIAIVISAAMSFGTLLIAQFLAIGGDTIGVLQAVLDTQFWLATHVVCITFGYATTFVAGFLGIAYFVRGFLTPTLSKPLARDLTRMIYGILCFSIFFSFVGTVLGGLWADDSWGRFWGWDPKENGALIIVLWNALVLHARWGGLVKDRGLACLAMGGNMATAWSWFGVNELGVGLHSYGFTDGVLLALGTFYIVQLTIIAIAASVPLKHWWSFKRHDQPTAG
ncbi:cytochrome c biogenesis protein CcsA, partial [Planctomycetaceae bacterium]|nr:cytochrome c biogenesis protein CcsA [Planctomycetaceae bacterium]